MGKAQRSVGPSNCWPACLSSKKSCWSTARAACTAARAKITALKLSRNPAASRYSRRASESNSRIIATNSASTSNERSSAMPRSSGFRIGDDPQRGIEIGRIVELGLELQVTHTDFVGCLLDRHQQREELRQLDTIET